MTTSPRDDQQDASAFERKAREAFDDSASGLDAATLSRLNQSRQRALAAARARAPAAQRWWIWAPAGALAAAALVAVLLAARTPATRNVVAANPVAATNTADDATLDPLTVMAEGDDLQLAAEAELDFYAWVALETADDGVT